MDLSVDTKESDSSVLSTNSPVMEPLHSGQFQRWVRQESIKDLKHQLYDCMLEVDDDGEGNETIDTDENLASSRSFENDDVLNEHNRLPSNGELHLYNKEADQNDTAIPEIFDVRFIGQNEKRVDSVFASVEKHIEMSSSRSQPVSEASNLGSSSSSSSNSVGSTVQDSNMTNASKKQTITENSTVNANKKLGKRYPAYNPTDYLHLDASDEIRKLFSYIEHYKPKDIVLDTILKPFIPAYIPAIGQVDNFLKVPRPDGNEEKLGIYILDEPALYQTDAAVLELQLQIHSKKRNNVTVRSLEGSVSLPHNKIQIENWINSIDTLRKTKHSEQVLYKKPMPSLHDILMEPWPEDFNEALKNETIVLPDAKLDLPLADYGKLLCSILDIPVHDGHLIESIHLMFSLFMEFKANTVSV
jgi:hypothetical protein